MRRCTRPAKPASPRSHNTVATRPAFRWSAREQRIIDRSPPRREYRRPDDHPAIDQTESTPCRRGWGISAGVSAPRAGGRGSSQRWHDSEISRLRGTAPRPLALCAGAAGRAGDRADRTHLAAPTFVPDLRQLQTIPGIGPIVAATVPAVFLGATLGKRPKNPVRGPLLTVADNPDAARHRPPPPARRQWANDRGGHGGGRNRSRPLGGVGPPA